MKRLAIPLLAVGLAAGLVGTTNADFDLTALNNQVQNHEARITALEQAQPAPSSAPVAAPAPSPAPDNSLAAPSASDSPTAAPVTTADTSTAPAPQPPHLIGSEATCSAQGSYRIDEYSDGSQVRVDLPPCSVTPAQ